MLSQQHLYIALYIAEYIFVARQSEGRYYALMLVRKVYKNTHEQSIKHTTHKHINKTHTYGNVTHFVYRTRMRAAIMR